MSVSFSNSQKNMVIHPTILGIFISFSLKNNKLFHKYIIFLFFRTRLKQHQPQLHAVAVEVIQISGIYFLRMKMKFFIRRVQMGEPQQNQA